MYLIAIYIQYLVCMKSLTLFTRLKSWQTLITANCDSNGTVCTVCTAEDYSLTSGIRIKVNEVEFLLLKTFSVCFLMCYYY